MTTEPSQMQRITPKALHSWLRTNKSPRKEFVLLCGLAALVICVTVTVYLRRTTAINNRVTGIHDRSSSRDNLTNEFSSLSSKLKEAVDNLRRPGKNIFIAFSYWEQLTLATNNFLDLTALAAYGGRHVVVPFVRDSSFYGSPTEQGSETLALYYNVTALNQTLRSRGHGTLISWKEFQDVCQGKLDVLVHFDYTTNRQTIQAFFLCNISRHVNTSFTGFKVGRTICMNVFAVDSIEKFENEVVNRLPCVGLTEWKGCNKRAPFRAQFNLSSVVTHLTRSADSAVFFNSKLLQVARDFITKNLGPHFVSVHIRTERILKYGTAHRNITAVKKCISNVLSLIQRHKNVSTAHIPVFLAADFADYGSSSKRVKTARENAKSLMKILAPLNAVIFQPSTYNLTDRGEVAIVEMNILVSGEHLFAVGGGTFQKWIVNQFLNKNSTDKVSFAKRRSKMCNCFYMISNSIRMVTQMTIQ
ncbi:uncharacterized protein LOC144663727 [Oculina patagonica]